ncbi:hypothetical protein MicloDRAFT_00007660 [Microvirga lotononidis]|uniref:Transposase IS30-like HTH domain-containing protein n=1 Tax=Microvirga lotononidis TaxID=864069 RepID=I4Z2S4_9HYPH|nr:hypothetical protein MicloDRAFT_00007660 [Microvirga lotononidis]
MSIRKRRSDRSGRAPLPSPGRPPVAGRDEGRRFWLAIATGMSSEDAAVEAGVSHPVGYRWFRKAGGMPPAMFRSSAKPPSGRYLSLLEREEIALLRVQGQSMQEIGRRLGDLPRRSPGSCGATQPPAAVDWSIARRPPSGMPSDQPVARSRRSLPSTRPCALMWRRDWLASSLLRTALPFPALPSPGRAAGMASDRIGGGPEPGARSRLPDACRSTFRTTGPCASATKRSIRPSSSKAKERCAVNSRPACEPGGYCGCRGHVSAGAVRVLSRLRS